MRYAAEITGWEEAVVYPPLEEAGLAHPDPADSDREAIAMFVQNYGADVVLITEYQSERVVYFNTVTRPY